MSFVKYFVFSLMIGVQAHAGILFEPYAGYTMGDLKFTTNSGFPLVDQQNRAYRGSVDGFAYGAKLAWIFSSIYLGAEYQAARANEKLNTSGSEAVTWNNTSIFGILGYQMMNGIRLSYGMTVTPQKSEEAGDPNPMIFTGSAQKFSLGYRYNSTFAINVDYIIYDFDKFKSGSTEGKIKDRYNKLDYSAFLLSVSFPFEFGGR